MDTSLLLDLDVSYCSIGDEMPLTNGPTTRAMARRIQEEWALNVHARPKMNFTLAKEDVKT